MNSTGDWTKAGFTRSNPTDWEEHSRVGDVSTGRPYKAAQLVPDEILIDESTSDTYIGNTKPGTASSSALWRIRKIAVAAGVTSIKFADGDDQYDNVWDNRLSLSYS